jgi:type IV pilus assembly protein PilA
VRAARRLMIIRLILGVAVSLTAIFAVVIWPALAKPSMARDYAEETATLKAIQTLNTAQVQYNSQFGRYARSLTELGPSAANLIPADLSAGETYGYKFKLTETPTGYTISAVPVSIRSTVPRTFYSDQSLAIRDNYGPEPAAASDKVITPTNGRRVVPAPVLR